MVQQIPKIMSKLSRMDVLCIEAVISFVTILALYKGIEIIAFIQSFDWVPAIVGSVLGLLLGFIVIYLTLKVGLWRL